MPNGLCLSCHWLRFEVILLFVIEHLPHLLHRPPNNNSRGARMYLIIFYLVTFEYFSFVYERSRPGKYYCNFSKWIMIGNWYEIKLHIIIQYKVQSHNTYNMNEVSMRTAPNTKHDKLILIGICMHSKNDTLSMVSNSSIFNYLLRS